jgi:hypothetical protein
VILGVNLVLHKTPWLPLVQTSILAASRQSFKLSFFDARHLVQVRFRNEGHFVLYTLP